MVQMVREGAETGYLPNSSDFMKEFEVSRRTVARDLDFLRDEERAPLAYDDARGEIGLAVVPLDGFVSIDSGHHRFGEVVTRSFVFEGRRLEVNMRAVGWAGARGSPS